VIVQRLVSSSTFHFLFHHSSDCTKVGSCFWHSVPGLFYISTSLVPSGFIIQRPVSEGIFFLPVFLCIQSGSLLIKILVLVVPIIIPTFLLIHSVANSEEW